MTSTLDQRLMDLAHRLYQGTMTISRAAEEAVKNAGFAHCSGHISGGTLPEVSVFFPKAIGGTLKITPTLEGESLDQPEMTYQLELDRQGTRAFGVASAPSDAVDFLKRHGVVPAEA